MKSVNALGFIEMYGLIGCIEASDAMVKSANVRLIQYGEVSSGLVTVIVEGDVAACRAAVDAGVAAGGRLGKVVTQMVIPRPTDDTVEMILEMIPRARDEYKKHFGGSSSNSGGTSGGDEPPPAPPAPKGPASITEKPSASSKEKPEVKAEPLKKTEKQAEKQEINKVTSKVDLVVSPMVVAQAEKKENKPSVLVDAPKAKIDAKETKPKIEAKKAEQKKASVQNKKNDAAKVRGDEPNKAKIKPKSGVASVLAQFVQATEGAPFSEAELHKAVDYIAKTENGYTWKEISKQFPRHSKELQEKLDQEVSAGKLTKTGARYSILK